MLLTSLPFRNAAAPAQPLAVLTNAQQVIDLGMDGARRSPHPVHIRGVVTHNPLDFKDWTFVQDETAGILVTHDAVNFPREPGQFVEVTGVAGVGEFHTYVKDARMKLLGRAPLPEPKVTPIARLVAGADFGQWISIRCVVHDVAATANRIVVLGAWQGYAYFAWITAPAGAPLPTNWINAEIEMRGIAWTVTDRAARAAGLRLHVASTNDVQLLQAASDFRFDLPRVTASALRELPGSADARVKMSGVVTYCSPRDDLMFVRDETGPIQVNMLRIIPRNYSQGRYIERSTNYARPGDRVEVIGAPIPDAPYAPRLWFAEHRIIGTGEQPAPRLISGYEAMSSRYDGELVRIKARFVERLSDSGSTSQRFTLWLQSGESIFEAILRTDKAASLSLEPDSFLEVTGVCSPIVAELRRVRGVRVYLRDVADLRVLRESPPLLGSTVIKVSIGAGTLVALALGWVWMLRRQVARRTADLRASEDRFIRAFQASPAFIALIRLDTGAFVTVNEAFLKASGYSEAEVIGRTSLHLNLYAMPHQRDEYLRLIREQGSVRGREHLVRTKDGTIRTMLISGELLALDGQPHVLTVGLDITGRKQAEVETLKALAREKELSELKSNFVSMVSHEFRTPLGVIMSAAEILQRYFDRLPPEKRARHLEMIFHSTRNLAALMEEVLLLGNVEEGRMRFNPAPVQIEAFCRTLAEEVVSATHGACSIRFSTLAPLDGAVSDEGLLRHILTNLLSNAVKYSAPGSAVEFVANRRNGDAVFTVRDCGIGIPPEDQARLFSSFSRGRNVGERPGSGLGLVIVKRCVEMHGGTIEVSSAVGQGTCVTVVLPLFKSEPARISGPASSGVS